MDMDFGVLDFASAVSPFDFFLAIAGLAGFAFFAAAPAFFAPFAFDEAFPLPFLPAFFPAEELSPKMRSQLQEYCELEPTEVVDI